MPLPAIAAAVAGGVARVGAATGIRSAAGSAGAQAANGGARAFGGSALRTAAIARVATHRNEHHEVNRPGDPLASASNMYSAMLSPNQFPEV